MEGLLNRVARNMVSIRRREHVSAAINEARDVTADNKQRGPVAEGGPKSSVGCLLSAVTSRQTLTALAC